MSMTPMAIYAASTTASCSARVRTWPVSVMTLSLVSALTSLPSGTTRPDRQRTTRRQRTTPAPQAPVAPRTAQEEQASPRRPGSE